MNMEMVDQPGWNSFGDAAPVLPVQLLLRQLITSDKTFWHQRRNLSGKPELIMKIVTAVPNKNTGFHNGKTVLGHR